jgi:hypothetical protein
VCRACSEVVPIAPPSAELVHQPPALIDELTRPTDLRVEESTLDGALTLRFPPSRAAAIPVLAFAAMWDAFLVFWYVVAVRGGGGPAGVAFWFPLLHVGAGAFITYQGAKTLLNAIVIRLDSDMVSIAVGPLPARGAMRESRRLVQSFADAERRSLGTRRARRWTVQILTRDGRAIPMALELSEPDHARYLAARLNDALERTRSPFRD